MPARTHKNSFTHLFGQKIVRCMFFDFSPITAVDFCHWSSSQREREKKSITIKSLYLDVLIFFQQRKPVDPSSISVLIFNLLFFFGLSVLLWWNLARPRWEETIKMLGEKNSNSIYSILLMMLDSRLERFIQWSSKSEFNSLARVKWQ